MLGFIKCFKFYILRNPVFLFVVREGVLFKETLITVCSYVIICYFMYLCTFHMLLM